MIKWLFEGLARTIIRRPAAVAGVLIALLLIGFYGMTLLSMQTGWETYMDPGSPSGVVYGQYDEEYSTSTVILIVEAGDPLSLDVLNYVDSLETNIGQQQNIESTTGIVDILKAANGGTLPETREGVERIVNALPEETREKLYPSNVLTLVQIQLKPDLSEDVEDSVLNIITSIVEESDPPSGVIVEISGSPAFSQQMSAGLSTNTGILIGGALVLMIITMGILFAYVRHRFLPVALVATGLISSLGMMGIAGIKLNMAVIGAFPVLIGLGIDYAIQFHARFDEECRKGPIEDAVFMTVTKTGPAVMYAMLATSMGFVAMFTSAMPMIRSFGLVSIIGINTCYWVSCIGMPTAGLLLKYTPKPQKGEACYAVGTEACDTVIGKEPEKSGFSYGRFLTDVSVKIAKNPIPVLILVGCIALIGYQIDPTIPIDSDENSFVPADMPAKINMDKVTRILGSTSTADFFVRGASVTDLDTILWMEEFQTYELTHHSEFTGVTSIVTYILRYNGGEMPETQAELDAVLAKIPAETKEQYMNNGMSAIVRFSTIDMEMTVQESLKEQTISEIAFLEPPVGITVQPTGGFELYTTLLGTMSESKDVMTILGFAFVFAFLILVYRHVDAVSPIVPIIFIVGWNACMMYILGIDYTPLTATLGSMTIGVAAEYTILVMERYEEEQERLHDHIAAIQESVKKIGTAITVSGLATFFGFSALCLSTFPIVSNFGVTTLIAVAFSLMGAIFVMPAVLSLMGSFTEWLDARKEKRHPEEIPAGVA
ncbi:MAG TPA: hydrophobe/amphiphile efflux-3 (HAE3) family transporter [Methanoregulaceae archaeon]|nr:hydrophobe/amphiphile efflux-3 (HAE3) family transporter [Methanoregulaceae archaeon]HRY75127.1 hydrophobe/amphiphile efflux-3 (HAE3) family transporter [Methanoregulaceae archaeon]